MAASADVDVVSTPHLVPQQRHDRPSTAATPAAATHATAAVLAGPSRPARVVHSGADAAYLQVDDGHCVAILAARARAVPCGLRTDLPGLDVPLGAVATVGSGSLRLAGMTLRVGRLVDAGVPRPPTVPAAAVAAIADHPAVRAVRAELPDHAIAHLRDGDPRAVAALLGRGPGLTPVGDDVLCGYLATAVATSCTAATTAVTDEVTALAPQHTTALSAELLACAVRGEVLPEFATLLRTLPEPGAALAELVTVGHTSGAGLALGLTLAPIPSGRTTP